MSPAHSPRQLLIWSIPTFAVLLSIFWYRRRKTPKPIEDPIPSVEPKTKPINIESSSAQCVSNLNSPNKPITYSRSLSGVDSAPIDIVSSKSAPLIVSDKELDLEIEKLKSMRKKQGSQMSTPAKKKSLKTEVTPDITSNVDEDSQHSDRDSANHSPVNVIMPTSPSLSCASDNQSDSDSGKGGSDVATPPPGKLQQPTKEVADTEFTVFEFVIPQQLVGRLIGKHGAFVHQIREKTNARILVKRHPGAANSNAEVKMCAIEGLKSEIDAALGIIRSKFPLKRYPELTLEQVAFVPVVPPCMSLHLIEGVNNDTIVSCVVTPAHLFLQQPTHPTFLNLNVLSDYMNACYADVPGQTPPPRLPVPVQPGTICAAESANVWYRASVISSDDSDSAYVQFLDYGGFANVPHSALRQIRGDFLLLPFQASECLLADVEPLDEAGWCQEAFDLVLQLTTGAVVFTQVVDYAEEESATPLVRIYIRDGNQRLILLNRELVDRSVARCTSRTLTAQ